MPTKKDFCGPDYPGPGQYPLPPAIGCKSTDVTLWHSPCYSFGIKPKVKGKEALPGPAEYTIGNVTRFGKITTPSAPFTSRRVVRQLQPIPGPGAYYPESHLNAVLYKAPSYPFGQKARPKQLYVTPGPNAYSVTDPGVFGKRPPSFSITGRRSGQKPPETPGPAAYGAPNINFTSKRVPAFSMGARRFRKAPDDLPGPGAYSPDTRFMYQSSPGFTITGRPSPCIKPFILPSDNHQ